MLTFSFYTTRSQAELHMVDGVLDVHDLHVWSISTDTPILTAHVHVEETADTVCRDDGLGLVQGMAESVAGGHVVVLQPRCGTRWCSGHFGVH